MILARDEQTSIQSTKPPLLRHSLNLSSLHPQLPLMSEKAFPLADADLTIALLDLVQQVGAGVNFELLSNSLTFEQLPGDELQANKKGGE